MIKTAVVRAVSKRIALASASLPAMDTVVDALRWEPNVKTSSWKSVPKSVKDQLIALSAADPAGAELDAILRSASDDAVLNVAWAEVPVGQSSEVCGWAIANLWETSFGSEGVILVFLRNDFNNVRVHEAIAATLLNTFGTYGQADVVNDRLTLTVSQRDDLIYSQLIKKGYKNVQQLLP